MTLALLLIACADLSALITPHPVAVAERRLALTPPAPLLVDTNSGPRWGHGTFGWGVCNALTNFVVDKSLDLAQWRTVVTTTVSVEAKIVWDFGATNSFAFYRMRDGSPADAGDPTQLFWEPDAKALGYFVYWRSVEESESTNRIPVPGGPLDVSALGLEAGTYCISMSATNEVRESARNEEIEWSVK